ncbi:MAG TPA: subclass B3 metallo-beta-lactamase [Vicinamibacterales bacterium]|nr:subclass B3 metallo-beta-lactamase [Vicinamibacterales bacterium]
MTSTFSRMTWALAAMTLLVAATGRGDQSSCDRCPVWNLAQPPFQIYGNTYYVGVRGLSAILIASPEGHVLIDGALPESAARIADNVRALGFRIEDVKLIANSHVHYDHAGGIAELQRLSGAEVVASAASAAVLKHGGVGRDDPQFGILLPIRAVRRVRTIADGETLHVGPLALTAHLTPGHTPGGTTWTWSSCEQTRCLDVVYADSLSAISADGFLFSRNHRYPHVVQDFERSFARMSALRCDILVSTHPEVSNFWDRLAKRTAGDANALVDAAACARYVELAREGLAKRLAREASTGKF